MLLFLTSLTDFLGMCFTMWLAAYLLARGFPGRVTLSAVVTLAAVSLFFLGAYLNIHYQIPGTAAWRATLLTLALIAWYDLTFRLLPAKAQRARRWVALSLFGLSLVTIALLIGGNNAFVAESGNPLGVARMSLSPAYVVYGAFQLLTVGAALTNFRRGTAPGAASERRHFRAATILAAVNIGYGIVALILAPRLPRIIQDGLLLCTVSMLGYSVARYQTLIERRTTLQDFPVSAAGILGLAGIYALAARLLGISTAGMALLTLLAILTHSAFGVAREFLDRLLHRHEGDLRRQLRWLAHHASAEATLTADLQQGLSYLCRLLNATGGFVAIRHEEQFAVSASLNSLAAGRELNALEATCDDLCRPPAWLADRVDWLAPAFVGGEQSAVVGLGPRMAKGNYIDSDLDLLAELADWVGLITANYTWQQSSQKRLTELAAELQSGEAGWQKGAKELEALFGSGPDAEFVRAVEDGLRNLSDYTKLGQSGMASRLSVAGSTHIERSKSIRQRVIQAIDSLRPAAQRPGEPLPREWHSYVILHDAYVEDVPNREIMARLYISEGTFNRVRRKAIRAVARSLLEIQDQVGAA